MHNISCIDAHTHRNTSENRLLLNLSDQSEDVPSQTWFSAGIHPWFVGDRLPSDKLSLLELHSQKNNCLAIGECGIDRLSNFPLVIQEQCFDLQVKLALKSNKPLIIHDVRSTGKILEILSKNQFPLNKTLFHGFNSKPEKAKELISSGAWISLGKALMNEHSNASTFLKNNGLRNVLFETDDSPYSIDDIYRLGIKYTGLSEKELIEQVEENFHNLFNIR